MLSAPVTWAMRPAATLAWGYMTMAKAAITTPFITREMYWMMAKMSPAAGAPRASIRPAPT